MTALPHLLHGKEARVWGDQAYRGQREAMRKRAPRAQDFTHRRYRWGERIEGIERAKSRTKSSGRSRVEHVFGVIKGTFLFNPGREHQFRFIIAAWITAIWQFMRADVSLA